MGHDGPVTTEHDIHPLAEEYWQVRMEQSPIFATFLGDHRFDDRVDDMSVEADARRRGIWSDLQARVTAVDGDGLTTEDQVTRALLLNELADGIEAVDLRLVELESDQMRG